MVKLFFFCYNISRCNTWRGLQYSRRISDAMLVKSRTCWRPGTRGHWTWNTEEPVEKR